MQRYAGSCSPEQLHRLQKIFDLICMELRANGQSNYTGPMDPDGLREEITLSDLDVQLAVSHNRYGESLRCTLSG